MNPSTESEAQTLPVFVLVVAHDDKAERAFTTFCNSEDFTVTSARAQRDALQLLRQHKPDVLILDSELANDEALALLSAVRRDPGFLGLVLFASSKRGSTAKLIPDEILRVIRRAMRMRRRARGAVPNGLGP